MKNQPRSSSESKTFGDFQPNNSPPAMMGRLKRGIADVCGGDWWQRSGSAYHQCLCMHPAMRQAYRAFRWVAYILAGTIRDWPKGKLRPMPPRDWL